MPEWLELLLAELAKIPEIIEVAAADDSGTFLAGSQNEKPDEFAAVLAFLTRSASTTGDIVGLETLRYISVIGPKDRLLVYRIQDTLIGLRLSATAIISKLEGRLEKLIEAATYSSMEE